MELHKKGHGLTLYGKIRKAKSCPPVSCIICLELLECNTKESIFWRKDRLSRLHPARTVEVSDLPISPSSPIRLQAKDFQDASCRASQGRIDCEYPAAMLQRLRINQATAPCICRAEKALHKIAGTLCSRPLPGYVNPGCGRTDRSGLGCCQRDS